MTLSEFLATASADHAQAVIEANDYQPMPFLWRIEGPVRKTQVETGLIINDTEARLRGIVADETGAYSETQKSIATKIIRAIEKLYHPEFYINLSDPEVAQLFSAAHSLALLNLDEVSRITEAAMHYPQKNWGVVTLHDVLIERNACPAKPVTQSGGWVTITTTADCPAHRPQLMAFNARTQQWQRVNNFGVVSVAGVYDCRVPNEWLSAQLAVDDPYGVI